MPFQNDQGEWLVAEVNTDIAERARAEEALRASEERLRLALSAAEMGTWRWVPATNQDTRDGSFNRILGLEPVESTQPVEDFLGRLHSEDRASVEKAIQSACDEHRPYLAEFRIVRPDGQVRWLRDQGKGYYNQTGEMTYMTGAVVDITRRKRAEEGLKRYAADQERANREVRQFAYIVSHDLRAPLINLKGFAGELRSTLEEVRSTTKALLPQLPEEQRRSLSRACDEDMPEALQFIESSASRMDRFINSILKLSRMGHRELMFERINMDDLVRDVLQDTAFQIEERGIKMKVGHLPEITADRTSMEQIMGNLLSNAVKYLDPSRPGVIEITSECEPDRVTFHVRDNGRGIAASDMEKVFAPFRRAGKQDVEGEGMGLAYAQTLVKRHGGGRIKCESEEGVETTFSFAISTHPEQGDNHG